MLKSVRVALAMLFGSGLCWGQADEIEKLNNVVQRQQQEIEELKGKLARIERALGLGAPATLEPVSYSPQPSQVPPGTQTATTPPAPAGFRFSGDFRFRLDAGIRGATPTTAGLQNIRGRYRLRLNADREQPLPHFRKTGADRHRTVFVHCRRGPFITGGFGQQYDREKSKPGTH